MTVQDNSSVIEQNRLLSQLLSLFPTISSSAKKPPPTSDGNDAKNKVLVVVSDKVPAGRGLVFTRNVEPGQVLLRLPAEALINVKSFRTFFHPDTLPNIASIAGSVKKSDHRLSSAQLLSLLLARARVQAELTNRGRSQDAMTTRHEALRLFVKTLPASFNTVPLTWSLYARSLDHNAESSNTADWKQRFFQTLLQALPQHSQQLEHKVRLRFEKDWDGICSMRASNLDMLAEPSLLTSNPGLARSILTSINQQTFLWAWLCVNSRCVFLPLGLAEHADNFTLAPMLDMANHTPDPALECKVNYTTDGGLELCAPSPEQQTLPESKSCVRMPSDECFITYGPHSNECLLSEYGFVLPAQLHFTGEDTKASWSGSRYVDVLFDKEVEALLAAQGKEGEAKIELLQSRGYWQEFTIHPYPEPAHPSHRLIPALRLAALDLDAAAGVARNAHKVAKTKAQPGVKAGKKQHHNTHAGTSELDKWEETLTGYREKVSDENEERAHAILVDLCDTRRKHTEQARRRWSEAQAILNSNAQDDGPGPDRVGCALSLAFVKQLLDEEEAVLRLVSQSAQEQVEW